MVIKWFQRSKPKPSDTIPDEDVTLDKLPDDYLLALSNVYRDMMTIFNDRRTLVLNEINKRHGKKSDISTTPKPSRKSKS